MQRISVPLDSMELDALVIMASSDCRHPREQMRYLLRAEAVRRSLWIEGQYSISIAKEDMSRELGIALRK